MTLQAAPEAAPAAVTPGTEITYYIYSFDGKLLAEYNSEGACTRDYVYLGGRVLTEYRASEGGFYYYTPDQINTTRIVTDAIGNICYSHAFDPYGGDLKTWTNTCPPKLNFSGKERDSDTGLDYFGARWYAQGQQRWVSVDPVMNRDEAIVNPQLWNLYAYCRNNPTTFMDPDGREENEYQQSTGFAWVDQKIEAAWRWISDKLMPEKPAINEEGEGSADYEEATGIDPSIGASAVRAGFKDATETIGSEFTKTGSKILMVGALNKVPVQNLIPGSLKRSTSWHTPYAEKTVAELELLARTGDQKAKGMLKLAKEAQRLLEKVKGKSK